MSELRNVPVICENRHIGFLQCISLDKAQKRVSALIVICGMRGKCVVLPEHVLSIADGFILISQFQKYRRAYETKSCYFVRDTTGLLAGRITDYAIDEDSFEVVAMEMAPGYMPTEFRKKTWIYAYAVQSENPRNELVIPDLLCSELSFSRGVR